MKTIAVIFGGNSNEREISVITGMLAVNLLWEKYRVIPVYWGEDGKWYSSAEMRTVAEFKAPKRFPAVALEGRRLLSEKKRKRVVAELDCALNCCHGGFGEDGTLAALLAKNGVPFASPPVAVSAVFMNKAYGKIAAKGLGIPVVDGFTVREGEDVSERAKELGYPVIVKPVHLGSSIGIRVAHSEAELNEALELSFELDDCALVERYLAGKRDINCAAYKRGNETALSPCEEVFSGGDILSFSDKYEGTGERKSVFPADLPKELADEIRDCTRLIYESFDVRGVVRADFLVADGKAYFNELNTVPGSLASYLFGGSLTEARDFLCELVEEAKPPLKRTVVKSGILESDVFAGSKACKNR